MSEFEAHVMEFDCIECGAHIVRICAEPSDLKLCGQCVSLPSWFKNEELRNIIDPEHDGLEMIER